MLELRAAVLRRLVAHCVRAQPHEGCGLLVGTLGGAVHDAVPTQNAARSALVYEIDPDALLRVDREAAARDLDVVGVFHSHTHTAAWPSPTDVARAVDPGWHFVVVSLRDADPEVRSFRIAGGEVEEEPIVVTDEVDGDPGATEEEVQ